MYLKIHSWHFALRKQISRIIFDQSRLIFSQTFQKSLFNHVLQQIKKFSDKLSHFKQHTPLSVQTYPRQLKRTLKDLRFDLKYIL